MQMEKVNDWLTLAANVGVLAGIVFLGLEINQNTKTLRNESYQYMLATLSEGQNILATDRDLHRIVSTGERSPAELSAEEWSRFAIFVMVRLSAWEYLYMMKQEDSVSPVAWSAFDPGFRAMVCMRGYRRFFQERSGWFAPEFIAYLEAGVFPDCG